MFKELELKYIIYVGKTRGFICLDELITLVGQIEDYDDILSEIYDYLSDTLDLLIITDVNDVNNKNFRDDINFNIQLFDYINYLTQEGRRKGYIISSTISSRLPQPKITERALKLIHNVLCEEGISIKETDPETAKYLNNQQFRQLLHGMFRKIHEILDDNHESEFPRHYKRVRGMIQTAADLLDKTPEELFSNLQNQMLLEYFRQIENLIIKELNKDQIIQNCLHILGVLEVFLPVYEGLYEQLSS